MTFSIRKKLYFGFFTIITLFLVTTVLTTYLSQRNARLSQEIIDSGKRLELVQRLNLFARTANDNGAHYLPAPLFVEEEYLARFHAATDFVDQELERLIAMRDGEGSLAQIENFSRKWAAYVEESEQIFASKRSGHVTEAQESFTRDSFDPIAFSLHKFYMDQTARIALNHQEIERNAKTIRTLNITMMSLALILSVFTAVKLSSYLIYRIRLLMTSAQKVAGGDLQVADLRFRGRDELSELAHAFNKMTQSLRTFIDSEQFFQHLSMLDGLTGIPNRRCYDETLAKEWTQLAAGSQPLTLMLIDIDYFKKYNDRYGHQAGDECLRRVAGLLQDTVAADGLAARYGGEEFAVLLPDRNAAHAKRLAERFQSTLAQAQIAHEESEVGAFITVSIGVASLPASPHEEPGTLLQQADHALYQVKRTGRNRVGIYDPADGFHETDGKGV